MRKPADPKKKSKMAKMFARYETYDGEPGSPEQWAAAAASMVDPHLADNLTLLGLEKVPDTLDDLKKKHRTKIRAIHPDQVRHDAYCATITARLPLPCSCTYNERLAQCHAEAATLNAAAEALEKMIRRPAVDPETLLPPSAMLVNPPRCTAELPRITCNEPLTHAFTARHVGEVKMNGEREMLYLGFDPYGRRPGGTTMLSRQKAKDDKLYCDKTDQVPHITGTDLGQLGNTVLDGEVFLTDWNTTHSIMGSAPGIAVDKQAGASKITYYVFDVAFHKGKDVRKLPRRERRELVEQICRELGNPWIVPVKQFKGVDLDQAFRDEVAKGGEGLVIKDEEGTYGQSWAKYKKCADVSCFVIGFSAGQKALAGMVGSIELGVYDADGKVVSVGYAGTGFDNKQRHEITDNQDAWMGKVVDVWVFELTKRGQLLNPSFHRERPDVAQGDCTMAKLKDDVLKHLGHRE